MSDNHIHELDIYLHPGWDDYILESDPPIFPIHMLGKTWILCARFVDEVLEMVRKDDCAYIVRLSFTVSPPEPGNDWHEAELFADEEGDIIVNTYITGGAYIYKDLVKYIYSSLGLAHGTSIDLLWWKLELLSET
jgi:hypothetical protein